MTTKHRWKFFRAGGVDQLAVGTGSDVTHLTELDPKLWVALSMPTKGVAIDARTLELLDTDHDGRVRIPEVQAAARWVGEVYAKPDHLFEGGDSVPLAVLADGPVRTAARKILDELGKKSATEIALADVANSHAVFAAARFNGDGVVTPAAVDDPELHKLVEEMIVAVGGVADRSGVIGVNQAEVDEFFDEAKALLEWTAAGEADAAIRPIGDATAAAAAAVAAVRAKVEDYFTRCRLAAVDARAAAALAATDGDYASLAGKDLSAASPEVARLPLARIEAGRPLPLAEGLNPAWAAAVGELAHKAVQPLLGARATLIEVDWRSILAKLAAHEKHAGARPKTKVGELGIERLRALVAGGSRAALVDLITRDLAVKEEFDRIVELEKLVRVQRDFVQLLRNYVSFSDFYGGKLAAFQAGTLYLDGRGCRLTVEVADAAKHGALAGLAGAYLAYCDLTRAGGAKKTIAAAFTGGDSDNLLVGRNGVFIDRDGKDWDATITKVVDNPISLRQAFWSPYKKLARLIEEQIAKRAGAADAAATDKLAVVAATTANVGATPKPPDAPKKIDVGTVAAIGVAVGGIGALVVGVLGAFFGLGAWMPIGILALLLMISGPSMLLAWLKLRQRNLGPILDANGWAINGRARINVPFGATLTELAALPPGSQRALDDPFADKRRPWKLYGFLIVLLALGLSWYLGKLDRYLPAAAKSTKVLGKYAPTAKAAPATPAPAPAAPPATPAP